ncbi:leucine-rich repeat-containing protein 74A-like [Gigantopelta aegis]|uniref:leucine-rich repeat-containing protein 74A-like n=1 Tax=Gigantopelta aegis TaxID=1735272 RepID=UPI001B88A4B9|nr:leucine-rich repeat-containing protein 74A-like [Gigantopelta aegis]
MEISADDMTSRQTTNVSDSDYELVELMCQPQRKREFTFTGYDIMSDIDPDICDGEQHLETDHHLRLYLDACKLFGVLPLVCVKKSLQKPDMVMRNASIDWRDTRALAVALVGNQYVKCLDLHGNNLGPKGVISLSEMLAENVTITDINNASLRELRCSHNKFGEIGGLYLGPAIASNDTIEVLDLSWNHLRGKGAMAVAAGMETNGGVKTLNISWNGFGKDGCSVLAQSLLSNATMTELDVSCNRVDKQGVAALMRGLQGNEVLETLRIGQNPISPDIAVSILRTIELLPKCSITHLDLKDVAVNEDFLKLGEKIINVRNLRIQTGPLLTKGEFIKEYTTIANRKSKSLPESVDCQQQS